MRHTTQRRARPRSIAFVLLAVTVCLLAVTAPAFASSSPQPAAASPGATDAAEAAGAASPAPADAASPAVASSPIPSTLTCVLSKTAVVFGDPVTVSGQLDPVAAGQEVTVKLGDAVLGTATSDAAGAYALTFTPARSGDVVAQLVSDPSVVTAPQALSVKPKVSVSHGTLVPFLPSRVVVKVTPSAYDGVVVVEVVHRGVTVGTFRVRAKDGRAVLHIPFRGVDGFTLNVTLPAAAGLDGRSFQAKVGVPAKTLSAGSSGPYVKGMLTGLQRLKFIVPGVGSRFSTSVKDSVMAFQKAYRLSRTYVFNTACWRKLDGARLIKPKYSSPSTHIEVDKTRQILMVVKGGKPIGIICVSTGATNNTPEGSFHIQQMHPFTTSGYGGILVRTMGFIGNFAIHGYAPVPPYPASHGCIREPIWASYWVFDHSFVREALYVYH
jgi:peptidoglycan hydrolase-like protein with peptidoglycan-binding domain